jgi:endogenous inhibitor of DNA gyrase (YacG/DUF329 family)
MDLNLVPTVKCPQCEVEFDRDFYKYAIDKICTKHMMVKCPSCNLIFSVDISVIDK